MIEQEQAPALEHIKFGTDGIRGEVGREITPELAYKFGRAVGLEISCDAISVGGDTRESTPLLAREVMHGIQSTGKWAINAGMLPTPVLDFIARHYQRPAIAITASHNPARDNGFKLLMPGGGKPSDQVNSRLESRLNSSQSIEASQHLRERTLQDRSTEYAGQYIDFIANSIRYWKLGLLENKVIASDTASGAYYEIAPEVYRSLGAEVIQADSKPNGKNINLKNGVQYLDNLIDTIQEGVINFDYGIANDGDGDRVLLVDPHGRVLNGDHILYILAKHLKQFNELPNNLVWGTEYSGQGLQKSLRAEGIKLGRARNGDRYVAQAMASSGAVLGAERSGHVIYGPLASTGDGLLAAIKTLEAVRVDYKGNLADAYDSMLDYPRAETVVKLEPGIDGNAIVERAAEDVRKIEEAIKKVGRVVVRASGTEPVIRIMVEAKSEDIVANTAEQLKQAIDNVA